MQTDEIFEELKDKSFKGAKTVSEIPKLAAFQKSLLERQKSEQGLAPDVVELIRSHAHNREQMMRVNAVIRALLV